MGKNPMTRFLFEKSPLHGSTRSLSSTMSRIEPEAVERGGPGQFQVVQKIDVTGLAWSGGHGDWGAKQGCTHSLWLPLLIKTNLVAETITGLINGQKSRHSCSSAPLPALNPMKGYDERSRCQQDQSPTSESWAYSVDDPEFLSGILFQIHSVRGKFPWRLCSLTHSLNFQVEYEWRFKFSDGLGCLAPPPSISLPFLFLSFSSAYVITLTPPES